MTFHNLDHRFWLDLSQRWQQGNALPLPDNARDIQVSIFCAERLEEACPKRWYAQLCLFESEEKAWHRQHSEPEFNASVVDKASDIRWSIRRLTLFEVSQDITLTKRLKQRLRYISDYAYDNLPDNTEWYWYLAEGNLLNVAWIDGCYLPPQPSDAIAARDLPFYFYEYAPVYNTHGLAGIMSKIGCVLPCQYTYLHVTSNGPKRFLAEVSTQKLPDAGYCRECDLIDQDGRQLNPQDIQVIGRSGTFVRNVFVVQQKGADLDGLYGYMRSDGSLLGAIAWKTVRKFDLHYGRVQCPNSQLWGYLGESGSIAIEPQFSWAGDLDNSVAIVRDRHGLAGIIDRRGQYVIAPQWHDIESFEERFWLAENLSGEIGVIDESGHVVVDFRPKATQLQPGYQFWLSRQIDEKQLSDLKTEVNVSLGAEWTSLLQGQTRLGIMQGKLRNGEGSKALAQAGLWGRSVRLLTDISQRGLTKGSIGCVGWDYPNTASNYDLSVECPVKGLVPGRQYDVGIAWGNLELLKPWVEGIARRF